VSQLSTEYRALRAGDKAATGLTLAAALRECEPAAAMILPESALPAADFRHHPAFKSRASNYEQPSTHRVSLVLN